MITNPLRNIFCVLLFSVTLGLMGCENTAGTGSGGASSYGSCNFNGGGFSTCFDYTGSGYSTTASVACTSATISGVSGVYSSSSCSTSLRVGSCLVNSGQALEYTIRYYNTGWVDGTASTSCTVSFSGTYTSG